jgi:hypothetical protein
MDYPPLLHVRTRLRERSKGRCWRDLGNGMTTQSTVPFQRVLPMLLVLSANPFVSGLSYASWALVRAVPIVLGPSIRPPRYQLLTLRGPADRLAMALTLIAPIYAVSLLVTV